MPLQDDKNQSLPQEARELAQAHLAHDAQEAEEVRYLDYQETKADIERLEYEINQLEARSSFMLRRVSSRNGQRKPSPLYDNRLNRIDRRKALARLELEVLRSDPGRYYAAMNMQAPLTIATLTLILTQEEAPADGHQCSWPRRRLKNVLDREQQAQEAPRRWPPGGEDI